MASVAPVKVPVHVDVSSSHDKHHIIATAFVAGVVVLNHRLALNLTSSELVILAVVLGVSQIAALVRLRSVLGALNGAPEAPAPAAAAEPTAVSQ